MSLIASLNVVRSGRKAVRLNGINAMRQKLIDRINDQIALAKALAACEAYQRIRYRRIRNLESDDIAEVPTKTRVRPWWAEAEDGSVLLWIKYGNQPIELQKGKTAIRLPPATARRLRRRAARARPKPQRHHARRDP